MSYHEALFVGLGNEFLTEDSCSPDRMPLLVLVIRACPPDNSMHRWNIPFPHLVDPVLRDVLFLSLE